MQKDMKRTRLKDCLGLQYLQLFFSIAFFLHFILFRFFFVLFLFFFSFFFLFLLLLGLPTRFCFQNWGFVSSCCCWALKAAAAAADVV